LGYQAAGNLDVVAYNNHPVATFKFQNLLKKRHLVKLLPTDKGEEKEIKMAFPTNSI